LPELIKHNKRPADDAGLLLHDSPVKKSLRQGYPVSLLMIDLDDFKKNNDTLGHPTGDIILREVSTIVVESIREIDLAARYGGEEFAVVLPYSGIDWALAVANRIRESISGHTYKNEASLKMNKITANIGVAGRSSHASTGNGLIQKADSKLLQVKQEGKNRVCVF